MTCNPLTSDVGQSFKDVMAEIATPVAVVTTARYGAPRGTTVSAFLSLSMHPPMVLVSLAKTSKTLAALIDVQRFGLNVLSADQAATAVRFASKDNAKFDEADWSMDNALPKLAGCSAWISCTVAASFEGGDHTIVVGDVTACRRGNARPLVYHSRQFGTHAPQTSF